MTADLADLITTLVASEPVFRRAAHHACDMQLGIQEEWKKSTGISSVDVVTQADVDVQEIILSALLGTTIQQNCQLVAEEDSPSVAAFQTQSPFILAIDPIDGTQKYAEQSGSFCTIVNLLGPDGPLYTYVYFPRYDWEVRMIDRAYQERGKPPAMDLPAEVGQLITYYGPQEPATYLGSLASQAEDAGYSFRRVSKISRLDTTRALVLGGQLGGYAAVNPSVYDGIVAYHYALAHGYPVMPAGVVDFATIRFNDIGAYFPGYYFFTTRSLGQP